MTIESNEIISAPIFSARDRDTSVFPLAVEPTRNQQLVATSNVGSSRSVLDGREDVTKRPLCAWKMESQNNEMPDSGQRRFYLQFESADQCARTVQGSICDPSIARKSRIQAGWAGQAGAVTRFPSVWALSKPSAAAI